MLCAWWRGLIRAISRYGGTLDDVWLGKELHDWLLILPTTAARLVSTELEVFFVIPRCLATIKSRL